MTTGSAMTRPVSGQKTASGSDASSRASSTSCAPSGLSTKSVGPHPPHMGTSADGRVGGERRPSEQEERAGEHMCDALDACACPSDGQAVEAEASDESVASEEAEPCLDEPSEFASVVPTEDGGGEGGRSSSLATLRCCFAARFARYLSRSRKRRASARMAGEASPAYWSSVFRNGERAPEPIALRRAASASSRGPLVGGSSIAGKLSPKRSSSASNGWQELPAFTRPKLKSASRPSSTDSATETASHSHRALRGLCVGSADERRGRAAAHPSEGRALGGICTKRKDASFQGFAKVLMRHGDDSHYGKSPGADLFVFATDLDLDPTFLAHLIDSLNWCSACASDLVQRVYRSP